MWWETSNLETEKLKFEAESEVLINLIKKHVDKNNAKADLN